MHLLTRPILFLFLFFYQEVIIDYINARNPIRSNCPLKRFESDPNRVQAAPKRLNQLPIQNTVKC